MAKEIFVSSFEELSKAASQLRERSQNYQEISNRIGQHVDTLTSAWEGKDQEQFVSQIREFDRNLKAMAEKIQAAAEVLEKQKAAYVEQQQHNIHDVKNLAH